MAIADQIFDVDYEEFDRSKPEFSYENFSKRYNMVFGVQIATITFVNYNGTVVKELFKRAKAKSNNDKF